MLASFVSLFEASPSAHANTSGKTPTMEIRAGSEGKRDVIYSVNSERGGCSCGGGFISRLAENTRVLVTGFRGFRPAILWYMSNIVVVLMQPHSDVRNAPKVELTAGFTAEDVSGKHETMDGEP